MNRTLMTLLAVLIGAALSLTPTDPRFPQQWALVTIRAPQAWDTTQGRGVTVAVLDTGHRPHPELYGRLTAGWDFVDGDSDPTEPDQDVSGAYHGMQAAGIIGSALDGRGVVGVAPLARVALVRICAPTECQMTRITNGIRWAAGLSVSGVPTNPTPAHVINLSLSGVGACPADLQAAINDAVNAGSTVVVAAGNNGANTADHNPGNCANVVVVAALNRVNGLATYSNSGAGTDVAAPGGMRLLDMDGDGVLDGILMVNRLAGRFTYRLHNGTSYATPHVSGVAALMYAVKPTITPTQVESILKSTVQSVACAPECGAGLIDAQAAVQAAAQLP